MRVLDLGAGKEKVGEQIYPPAEFPGVEVVALDINPEAEPDIVADVRDLPSDIGMFDAMVCSHVLEHLGRLEVMDALRGWIEHLNPGGVIHIAVPDLAWACEQIARGRMNVHVIMHIFGAQTGEWQFHKLGFTVLLLRQLLESAGLSVRRIQTMKYQIVTGDPQGDNSHREWSRQIYAEAIKPEKGKQ